MPPFTLKPIEDAHGNPNSSEFGFVVDHPAFWGLPIPGFPNCPQPTSEDTEDVKKLKLQVSAVMSAGSKWTNGQIRVFGTRMPPLFHALHHNTLIGAPRPFVPRDRRGNLPEAGEDALVGLCNLNFDNSGTGSVEYVRGRSTIAMSEFYRDGLIDRAKAWGYFNVEGNGYWDATRVGPLGALWIVLLNEDGTPSWFDEHLGGGYRLWHYQSHEANRNLFRWEFKQSPDQKNNEVVIQIGKSPWGAAWWETVELTLKLDWL